MLERYEMIGLGILVTLALAPPALTLMALLDWLRERLVHSSRRRWLPRVALAADLLLILCLAYGRYIEPQRITVTRVADQSPEIAQRSGPLKIVHISDIHFERDNPFLRRVLRKVAAERPDLILLTGDLPQLGDFDKAELYEWLRGLRRVAPVYSVPGYEPDALLAESPIGDGALNSLEQPVETEVRGTKITIQSLDLSRRRDKRARVGTDGVLGIVLNHFPDAIPDAARLKPDWFFCGHTHGGQIRLPFWGAVITASESGKRYEYGRYRIGGMQAFVTRGIGLEPRPAPQVRFLCPPEIVVLTISNSADQ